MRIGIVGHEAAKFTPETEAKARELIRSVITPADEVVSGKCHLGGVDLWAIDEAKKLGCAWREFPPQRLQWEGGYKQRNQQIADYSDVVYCIVVKELPASYVGLQFPYCYHCKTSEHVKSGGCYTTKQARLQGKDGETLVIK